MNSLVGILIVLYLAAAMINLSIGVLVMRRQQHPGSRLFACMMFAFALWSGGSAATLVAPDFETRVVLLHLTNIAKFCVPVIWLIAALCFAQVLREDMRNWRLWALGASVLPWALLELTSAKNRLLYVDVSADPLLGWPVFIPGPLFVPLLVFAEALAICGIYLIVHTLIRSSPYYVRHLPLIVTCCAGVLTVNLLFMAGVFPIDVTPIIVASLAAPILNLTLGVAPIERFRVVAVMRDGVLIISHSGIVMNMNAAAERMLGLREKQARGVPVQRLIDAFPAQVVQTVPHSSRQMLHFSVAGERLTAEMQIMPIRRRAEAVNGWIVHLRDITAAERARENAVILALEQRRLEILSSFISGAAHEFRTPLTIIRTCAFIAGRATNAEQRAAQHQRIGEQVLRMNRLLDQMRTMMRLDSGRGLNRQPVMLNMLVQREVAQHSGVLSGHPITLALEPMLPALQGDPDLIACALRELMLNAAQYSPQGSPIEVTTVRRQDGTVRLTVTDHGSGPSPEVRGRMFERMYRGDPARSTPGFGLGLSIVRSVAEAHGGCVEVDVTPGMGTGVHLMFGQEPLPIAIPQRVAAEPMVLLQ